jgi:ribosomal protein S27AE
MTDKPEGKEIERDARPCAKCGGQMRQGYIGDHGDVGSVLQLKWHPGVPLSWSLLGFLKFVREGSDDGIVVNTYRCPSCGCVEFIAP